MNTGELQPPGDLEHAGRPLPKQISPFACHAPKVGRGPGYTFTFRRVLSVERCLFFKATLPGSEGKHGLCGVSSELTGGHLIHLSRVTQRHLPTVKVSVYLDFITFQHFMS